MSRKINILKNILVGFGGDALVMILGIVVPRIMITTYGSDVNGLLNTVTQIFSYMALLEAGIGQAAKNALFKPLADKNREGVSYIASSAENYFRRVTIIYALGVTALSVLLPFVIKTDVDKLTVFLVIFFHGVSGVITFYYIQTLTTILGADGKSYVTNGIKVINSTLSYAVKIVMAAYGVNIALLQFVYLLITVGKVWFYKSYFNKHYSWIDFNAASGSARLENRNAFILTEIAWTVFSSTDMIILSVFVSTKVSSVYAVYNLVFHSIGSIWSTVYFSINYLLGQTYHKSRERYIELHDSFTSVFFGGMTVLMCTAYTLVMPFIRLYTSGVGDVNYIHTTLPVLFCLVQELSWSRYITGNLSGVAGYAKPVSKISLLEALSNVVLSLVLVQRFGIEGVLFATVVSLPFKVIYLTWLSEKIILKRKPFRYLFILAANFILFGACVLLNSLIEIKADNYLALFIQAIPVLMISAIIGAGLNLAVNPNCMQLMKQLRNREANIS